MRAIGCAMLALAIAAPAQAADLNVGPSKTVVHVHRHKLVRVHRHRVVRAVRDYDGTPIVMARRPDGLIDTYVAERAAPTRYFNGQPVTSWIR